MALALALALQAPDPSAEGLKALEARDYAAAIGHFTAAIEADPDDYTAHFNLGLAYSLSGRDDEAISEYSKTLELKPGLYQALVNLGTILVRQKHYKEALPHIRAAIEAKPEEARPHLLLGDAQFELGRFPEAAQAYYAALTAAPDSAEAELGYARALMAQQQLGEAEPHLRRAILLEPEMRNWLLELGEAYEKAGRIDDAAAVYRQFPENPAARERLGYMLLKAGRASEALPHLEWAAEQSPTAANRLALAAAYRANSNPEKALATIEAAVQAEPGNLDLRMAYGRELRDQRRFADAARQFDTVIQAKPDHLQAWNELTAMLVSLEQYGQAIAALDRIRALGAEQSGHVYLRAIVLDRVNDRPGAAAAYERFLEMSQGQLPDEEFKARQRLRILKKDLKR
ncbi:MAG: tetratricopeptide repeat protein [bacterium]